MVRWTSFALAALMLAGCPEKEDDSDDRKSDRKEEKDEKKEEEKKPDPEPEKPEPKLEIDNDTPGIAPRVRSELDGEKEGAKGTPMSIAGGRGVFQLPTGFTSKKSGNFDHAQTSDGKAHFAASKNEGDSNKVVEEATKALGLSECQWGAAESVTVGMEKVPATAQDGLCKKDGNDVKTFQVVYSGDANVVSVGAWMDDAKSSDVFAIARSIKPVKGGGGGGISACCAALNQNAASAPPQFKGAYIAAAGVCQSAINNPQARSMIRGALGAASLPAACR